MKLDLRIPIGLMFGIIGVVLVVYGLASDSAIYARSLGMNVNLWWGLVLVAFGAVMLALATRAERRQRAHGAAGPVNDTV
jgi:drug/metabolite transporter (DMT)-like permease